MRPARRTPSVPRSFSPTFQLSGDAPFNTKLRHSPSKLLPSFAHSFFLWHNMHPLGKKHADWSGQDFSCDRADMAVD
jgi:hypothetical protein